MSTPSHSAQAAGGAGRPGGWPAAVNLIARWLERRERLDALVDTLPAGLVGAERARCQHLVFGVVRHFGRLESALGRLIAHPPRFSTRAVLFVAGFELIEAKGTPEAEGIAAKVVHHAVEQDQLDLNRRMPADELRDPNDQFGPR